MTYTQAKKKFSGFTRWYNKIVKPQYKSTKARLWDYYCSELMNTDNIEISRHETKSGNFEYWW